MTPQLDLNAVEHRLITMRKSLEQLEPLGPVDLDRLEADPATGLVVERILALLVDLAFAINSHVAEAELGESPPTSAAGFGAAEKVGVIDAELAAALAPAEGPHHVLVQLCLDAEPEHVASVVSAAVSGYRTYVGQVDRWVVTRRAVS